MIYIRVDRLRLPRKLVNFKVDETSRSGHADQQPRFTIGECTSVEMFK